MSNLPAFKKEKKTRNNGVTIHMTFVSDLQNLDIHSGAKEKLQDCQFDIFKHTHTHIFRHGPICILAFQDLDFSTI